MASEAGSYMNHARNGMSQEMKKKAVERMLKDHIAGGTRDLAPSVTTGEPWDCSVPGCEQTDNAPTDSVCVGCNKRKRYERRHKGSGYKITKVKSGAWPMPGGFEDKPTMFHATDSTKEECKKVACLIRDALVKEEDAKKIFNKGVEKVLEGYSKGQLNVEFAKAYLPKICPLGLGLHKKATELAVAFNNYIANQCPTHFDDFMGLLVVSTGQKEVYLAPPTMANKLEAIGLELGSHTYDFDPFALEKEDKNHQRLVGWRKVVLLPGDALVIPVKWLHCIRSTQGTIGVSLKVELAAPPRPRASVTKKRKFTHGA